MKRRAFLGMLGAVPLALKINPEVRAAKLAAIPQSIPTIKKVIQPSLSPGWHTVMIKDVVDFESRSGMPGIRISLESTKGESGMMYISPAAPEEAMKFIKAAGVSGDMNTGFVVTDAIGKKIEVNVEQYRGVRRVKVAK